MQWGLANRISRILKPETGRTVMLAVDHGYFLGPTSGLEEPGKTIDPLLPYADSLMLTRGVLRSSVPDRCAVPIVLRVSGGTSILRELSGEGLTTAMEDALRLNASAVAVSIFVGSEGERATLLNLSRLVDMGRNIFQSDDPVGMIRAVRAVVHEGADPENACQIYLRTRAG